MKKARSAVIVALGAAALPVLTAFPASADPPPPATIDVVTTPEDCPVGVMVIDSSPKEGRITVSPDLFSASVGSGVPPEQAQKSCKMSLRLRMPLSSTYALKGITTSGTAKLDAGVKGEVTQRYRLQGNTKVNEISHTLKGQYDGSWRFADRTPLEFAPCGQERLLDLETLLRAHPNTSDPSKAGSISIDFPGGGTTYHFVWKSCKP